MTRKICCKCERPAHNGKDGRWYCDEHFRELKQDPNENWGLISFDGKRRKQNAEARKFDR